MPVSLTVPALAPALVPETFAPLSSTIPAANAPFPPPPTPVITIEPLPVVWIKAVLFA